MKKALGVDPKIVVAHHHRPPDVTMMLALYIAWNDPLMEHAYTIAKAQKLRRQRELERAKQEKG